MAAYTLTQIAIGLPWIHVSGYEDDILLTKDYFWGEGVRVGIIDSGVDDLHPDLSPNYIGRFPANDAVVGFHGTHVAGIVAAAGVVQLSGIAPKALIWDYPVYSDPTWGEGYVNALANAINHAINNDINVLNISLFLPVKPPPFSPARANLVSAVAAAHAANIVICVSSGNGGTEDLTVLLQIPQAANAPDKLLTVGALDDMAGVPTFTNSSLSNPENNIAKADYSSFGHERMVLNGVVGPGTMITSTLPGGGYGPATGTSMSTPFVSGVAAMIVGFFREANIGYSAKTVFDLIKGCTFNIPRYTSPINDSSNLLYTNGYQEKEIYIKGWNKYTGYGCINFQLLARALMAIKRGLILNPITNSPIPLNKEKLPLNLDSFGELDQAPGWPDLGPPPFSQPTDPAFLN